MTFTSTRLTAAGMKVKTFEVKPGTPESLLGALEADIAAKIQTLFGRCPTLCGFSVQDSLPKDIDQSPIPDAEYLGHGAPEPAERGSPATVPDWPANAFIPLT